MDVVGRLLAALETRIRVFGESGDPSGMLDPTALDEASRLWDAARPADGGPRDVSLQVLMVLACFHLFRYQELPKGQDQTDLRTALSLFGVLIARTPELVPDQIRSVLAAAHGHLEPVHDAKRLTAEGADAFNEYQRTGSPEVLDVALTAFQEAVAVNPPGHPDRPMYLSNLGAALLARFNLAGDGADLDEAIDAGRQAVAATAPGHPNRAMYLSNLGSSLHTRFEQAGDGADLIEAINAGRQAVAATAPGHPNRAMYLSNLGNSLHTRFEQAGDGADLDEAIDTGRQAVAVTAPGHPNRAMYLSNLGGCFL